MKKEKHLGKIDQFLNIRRFVTWFLLIHTIIAILLFTKCIMLHFNFRVYEKNIVFIKKIELEIWMNLQFRPP